MTTSKPTASATRTRRTKTVDLSVAPTLPEPWVPIHRDTLAETLRQNAELKQRLHDARQHERSLRRDVAVAWRDADLAVQRQQRFTWALVVIIVLLSAALIVAVA